MDRDCFDYLDRLIAKSTLSDGVRCRPKTTPNHDRFRKPVKDKDVEQFLQSTVFRTSDYCLHAARNLPYIML